MHPRKRRFSAIIITILFAGFMCFYSFKFHVILFRHSDSIKPVLEPILEPVIEPDLEPILEPISEPKNNMYYKVLKNESYHYLSPINSFRDNVVNFRGALSDDVKVLIGDIFRSTHGLTPITTEDGQHGWLENGVVYRPRRGNHEIQLNGIHFNPPTDFEYYVPYNEKLFFQGRKRPPSYVKPKIILWYARIPYVRIIPGLEQLRSCPDFPCRITTNQNYTISSSAMVFDGAYIKEMPPQRKPEQIFVFHHVETPTAYKGQFEFSHQAWRAAFNWTMSYRSDSDIPVYYGLVRKRPSPLVKDYKVIIANKTKIAVAVISQCNSAGHREEYIKALKKLIDVDIYGSCGTQQCPRAQDNECEESFSATYKFYFAFENSICEDYITEKFFRFISLDLIVVARGGQGYWRHVPPEIFINTADFKSPQHLAERLIHLDQHPEQYEVMLREKNKYMSLYEEWFHLNKQKKTTGVHYHYETIPFCRMCQWLWNLDDHTKCEPDIVKWFNKRTCSAPKDIIYMY